MFRIKSGSGEQIVKDVMSLMERLRTHGGSSVAVHQTLSSGAVKMHFLDVFPGGTVRESFGRQMPVGPSYFNWEK
jgi:hypothetical protein